MNKRRRGRPPRKFVLTQNGITKEVTYADLGVTRKQAWTCRQTAAIPMDVLERHLEDRRSDPYRGLRKLSASYTGAAYDNRIKIRTDAPGRAAWSIVSSCSPGYVEELIAFLAEYLRREKGLGEEVD